MALNSPTCYMLCLVLLFKNFQYTYFSLYNNSFEQFQLGNMNICSWLLQTLLHSSMGFACLELNFVSRLSVKTRIISLISNNYNEVIIQSINDTLLLSKVFLPLVSSLSSFFPFFNYAKLLLSSSITSAGFGGC